MRKPSLLHEMARAMYESRDYPKPWGHPSTIEKWHPVYFEYAKVAKKTYDRWLAKQQKEKQKEAEVPVEPIPPTPMTTPEPAPEPTPEPAPEPTEQPPEQT